MSLFFDTLEVMSTELLEPFQSTLYPYDSLRNLMGTRILELSGLEWCRFSSFPHL